MADDPEASPVAAPAGPRVVLVVDDESLDRFGAIPKHIVVGLADVAVRVCVLARTTRSPAALGLGPCVVVHEPPRRWSFRRRLPAALAERAAEGGIDMIHCLSVRLLDDMMAFPELARFPFAAHITDDVDLADWSAMEEARPRLWALAATPSVFKGVLDCRRIPSRLVKLVRLGVIGHSAPPVLAKPDHIPSTIVVAPLTVHCGLLQVLHAMQIVASAHPDITLFVLGTGPAERHFRHVAQQLGLQSKVIFVGVLSQWAEALLGCDILLLPGRAVRWTSHVLEAMAARRVVLATRDNDEDYLVDDQTASLFDPSDVPELARRWQRLIEEPETARRLADTAQRFVKTQHSPSVMVDALVEIYAEAMNKTPSA